MAIEKREHQKYKHEIIKASGSWDVGLPQAGDTQCYLGHTETVVPPCDGGKIKCGEIEKLGEKLRIAVTHSEELDARLKTLREELRELPQIAIISNQRKFST